MLYAVAADIYMYRYTAIAIDIPLVDPNSNSRCTPRRAASTPATAPLAFYPTTDALLQLAVSGVSSVVIAGCVVVRELLQSRAVRCTGVHSLPATWNLAPLPPGRLAK
jgi:hypothetical protein